MVNVGELAPTFTLQSDQGEEISLEDYRGQKVILYFYPKADTPGCTKQACAVRDAYPKIEAQDAVVLGISPDGPAALVKFREKYDLPFPLLSDPDHEVAKAYDVWAGKEILGKDVGHMVRSHFAIGPDGKLLEAKRKVKPETTADLALTFSLD